jgi:Helix-hairpin-helix motif
VGIPTCGITLVLEIVGPPPTDNDVGVAGLVACVKPARNAVSPVLFFIFPRRQLCFDRIGLCLPQSKVPGGVHMCDPQQSDDGLLQSCRFDRRCSTSWRLRVKPIDVQVSEWACTLERESNYSLSLRFGLGYAKGLRREAAEEIVTSREVYRFRSIEDLAQRIPILNRRDWSCIQSQGSVSHPGSEIVA